MKRALFTAVIAAMLGVFALSMADAGTTEIALVSITAADTAGVVLRTPRSGQTVRVRTVTLMYDNGAAAGQAYAGIVQSNAAHTRVLWFGQTMTSSGVETITWGPINYTVAAATAQAGLRLFISAASSDSLQALVEYEVIND